MLHVAGVVRHSRKPWSSLTDINSAQTALEVGLYIAEVHSVRCGIGASRSAIDTTQLLERVRCPTLMLHRKTSGLTLDAGGDVAHQAAERAVLQESIHTCWVSLYASASSP